MTASLEFRHYIQNKRIALVGGLHVEPSILLNYDIIVGCNYNDVSVKPQVRYIRNYDAQHDYDKSFITVGNHFCAGLINNNVADFLIPFGSWKNACPFGSEYEPISILYKKLQTNALTGFVALTHLLHNDAKEVYLCGMDLFEGKGKIFNGHNIENHYDYLLNLMNYDSRVKLELRMKMRMGVFNEG